ncbi:amino acid adenylation domain-containing protein [Streptomyces sp. NPDC057644]|uniref:amino acid adenylation domain-containing protein n=1 Tax=Streptomyces sp. NPDC057644 TaxID=3346191 RepID=UPI003679DF45
MSPETSATAPTPAHTPAAGSSHTDHHRLRTDLAGLWGDVLGIRPVDETADFTALGGNSLQAARIVARIRTRLGLPVTVAELFEHGTVTALARLLTDRPRDTDGVPATVTPAPGDGSLLAPAQRRLWFLDQLSPAAGAAYNVPALTRLRGPLDTAALDAAWQDVVDRHEQLRTVFTLSGDVPRTETNDNRSGLDLVDLAGHPDPFGHGVRTAQERAARHIDLATGPLAQLTLYRLAADDHLLLLVLPHLISDGRSLDVIDRDLAHAYRRHTGGTPDDDLRELTLEYRDFAHWSAALDPERLLRAWRPRLVGAPTVLDLPADHPRPATLSYRGSRLTRTTTGSLLTAARHLAAATRTTPYAVALTAYATLLGELTDRQNLLVATPMDGRPDPALEDVVGFFATTVPLRLRPCGAPDRPGALRRAVRETHGMVLDAAHDQHLPFEQLAAELAPAGDLSRTPLTQVALAYQGPRRPHARLDGLDAQPLPVDNGTAKFDLTVEIHESDDEFEITVEYATDLFSRERAQRMLDRYLEILDLVAHAPEALDGCAAGPDRLPAARHSSPAADPRCLHEIFAETAARYPHSVAVTDGARSLTYAELDRAANRLAHRLRAHGAAPDSLVGLCAERTVDLVVGVLAILKSGAGYLPLDPHHPAARLRDTLADAECRILLGDTASCAPLLDGEAPAFIPLTGDGSAGPDDHAPAPHPGAGPDTTAYVIYTSGSTGRPKGVVVTHANVTRLFTATEPDFGFGTDDVWTLFHSIAFDFSVWELWGPLLRGGRLVVVPYLTSRDPYAFLELLRTERVTVLNQTPTAFRQLAAAAEDADYPELALRTVVFGGEALDPATLGGWVGGYGIRRPGLVNMYGITETTVHVTVRPLTLADLSGSLSPIGRPVSDLRVHLLDADMNEVPDGVEGEMYVGGPGVARGYLNRPELTEQRFVPDPFGAPGESLYRSGDLAVRREDGELEYRGRIDHQVKLNGFRIELGEIERALLDQPGVRAGACVLREDTPGLPRLVGYVVPAPGHEDMRPAQLREALSVRLPAHMLPAAVIPLAELPLTGNGKLDRDRLPTPETHHAASARPGATEPRTPAEHTLAAVWCRVLDLPGLGVDDNFFALGGDSLRAVRVAALAREAGLPVSVEQIFLHPSVAALAAAAGTPDETPAPAPADCSTTLADLDPSRLPAGTVDAYPTAAMQLGILYECEFAEDETTGLYHDLISVRLDGPFDRPALEHALATLTERHAILRTAFRLGTFREPMQLVAQTAQIPLTVEEHGTGRPDAKTHEHLLRAWWDREKQDPFDAEQAPLVRCHVLRTDPDGFQLSLSVHHAILDGWSLALLTTELLLAYEGELRPDATGPALPPAPAARYRDFVAAEQRAQADPAARAWWEKLLRQEGEPAELPLDPEGAAEDEFAFHAPLPDDLDTALDATAARLGLPVKSLFLAAHARALAELTSSESTVTAVQVNGRLEEPGSDRVLGLLLNMAPLHLTARGTWAELAGAAFDAERARQPHRRYPLAALQQLTGRGTALFNVAFNYTDFHTFDDLAALRTIRPRDWWFSDRHSFPLMVEITRTPHTGRRALAVTLGADSPYAGTGARLGRLVLQALHAMAADPYATVSASDTERLR